ncbi:MAG: hypothetical protein VZR95_08910, partial [Alphaproteobacteria bacterium]
VDGKCTLPTCGSGDVTLSSCPTHGNCSMCSSGSGTLYILQSCNDGYTVSADSRKCINSCDGYDKSSASQCDINTQYYETCALDITKGKCESRTNTDGCQSYNPTKDLCTACIDDTYTLTDGHCQKGDTPTPSEDTCLATDVILDSCPLYGHCSVCLKGGANKYVLASCDAPYEVSLDRQTCQIDEGDDTPPCSAEDTNLNSCPDNGVCRECLTTSGNTKYVLTGCRTYYHMNDTQTGCEADDIPNCTDDDVQLDACPAAGTCSRCLKNQTKADFADRYKYILTACKEGYEKTEDNRDCIIPCAGYTLTTCPSYGVCSECSGKKKLDGCIDGYYLEGNSCQPHQTIEHCKEYSPISNTCTTCEDEYKVNETGTACEKMVPSTGSCSQQRQIGEASACQQATQYELQCSISSGYINYECMNRSNTAHCNGFDMYDDKCTSCESGYSVDSGICVITNCAVYNKETSVCSICVAGYKLENNACVVDASQIPPTTFSAVHANNSEINVSVTNFRQDFTGFECEDCENGGLIANGYNQGGTIQLTAATRLTDVYDIGNSRGISNSGNTCAVANSYYTTSGTKTQSVIKSKTFEAGDGYYTEGVFTGIYNETGDVYNSYNGNGLILMEGLAKGIETGTGNAYNAYGGTGEIKITTTKHIFMYGNNVSIPVADIYVGTGNAFNAYGAGAHGKLEISNSEEVSELSNGYGIYVGSGNAYNAYKGGTGEIVIHSGIRSSKSDLGHTYGIYVAGDGEVINADEGSIGTITLDRSVEASGNYSESYLYGIYVGGTGKVINANGGSGTINVTRGTGVYLKNGTFINATKGATGTIIQDPQDLYLSYAIDVDSATVINADTNSTGIINGTIHFINGGDFINANGSGSHGEVNGHVGGYLGQLTNAINAYNGGYGIINGYLSVY